MKHLLARSCVLALALLALPGLHDARAQGPGGFPSKPIRFIVAAAPGRLARTSSRAWWRSTSVNG